MPLVLQGWFFWGEEGGGGGVTKERRQRRAAVYMAGELKTVPHTTLSPYAVYLYLYMMYMCGCTYRVTLRVSVQLRNATTKEHSVLPFSLSYTSEGGRNN